MTGWEQDPVVAASPVTSSWQMDPVVGAPPPAFDPAPLRKSIQTNLKAAAAPATEGGEPKPATSFSDAVEAGFQLSVPALLARGKAPDKALSADAPWSSRLASKATQMLFDIPTMAAGALIGGAGGVETGPGAAITAMGGAFALPTALRETLMDSYTKGQFNNFGDFWDRASGIFIDTAKDWVTGAATGGAGKAAPALLPAAVSPTVRAAVTAGTEVSTMTTVGAALNGHVPSAQDFVDNAVMMGGFHAATGISAKLRDIYAKTGVKPAEVSADAAMDPTIAQDLLSSNVDMPRSYATSPGKIALEHDDDVRSIETQAMKDAAAKASPEAPPEGSVEEAQQKVLDKVSVGEGDKGKFPTLDQVYTNAIDDLHPLKGPSGDLPAAENPYQLARLTRGLAGKAGHMIDYGTFDFNTYENNGPSLRAVLDPVKGDLDGFRAYAVSRRAIELNGRGIESGIDQDAAGKVVSTGTKKFGAAFQGLVDYQNRIAAYARDSGVLSKDGYDAMLEANKNFVPFYRVMDEGAVGAKAGSGRAFRKIKGSDRTIIDPIESAVKNTYAITGMAERNATNKAFADLGPELAEKINPPIRGTTVQENEMSKFLAAHGLDDVPDSLLTVFRAARVPLEPGQIRVFEDGEPTTYKVDPDIAKALGNGLQAADIGMVQRLLAIPARLLRAGSVLTPEFALRHMFRDSIYAFATSDKILTPWDMAKGLAGQITGDKDYQNWLKSGGANISMVDLDRRYMQESLEKLTADTGLMSRSWNVIAHPLDAMRAIVSMSENASHLGAFKRYVASEPTKEDLQSAGFASRDISVDTARIGAKMRAYNMVTAFANVTMQDSDRVVRAFVDKPIATAVKIALGVSLPSALLWWANKDDERVKELPTWERDLFWIIPTDKWENIEAKDAAGVPSYLLRQSGGQMQMNNGTIYRISKPFGAGVVFGSGVERMLDGFVTQNPDAARGFGESLAATVIPSFVPSPITPVLEQFANRSTFTGASLVPAYAEGLLPEYQYTPYTTELTKALGSLIGSFPGMAKESVSDTNTIMGGTAKALTSPILLENYLRAWTGGLGMYALELGDKIARESGAVPNPVRAEGSLADIPVIKAFVARYPTAASQSVQSFYDTYQAQKVIYDTWLSRAAAGDYKAMQRVQAVDPSAMGKLDDIAKALTQHGQLIRNMNEFQPQENPDKEERAGIASDKRQLIDRLYYNMIEIARSGNQINASVAKSLASTVEK